MMSSSKVRNAVMDTNDTSRKQDDFCCERNKRHITRELAPATDLLLELAALYLTSLIQWSKTREQKFRCTTIFSHEIVGTDDGALLQEHVAGACCRSKLPRVCRP